VLYSIVTEWQFCIIIIYEEVMSEVSHQNNANQDIPLLVEGQVLHCHSEDSYRAALHAAGDRLVVVDCFASWCGPCIQMAPIFERFAGEFPDVVFIKMDMDQVPSLKSELSVWALPTFVFFKHGKKVGSFMGANTTLLRRGLENDGQVSMCSSFNCVIQ